MRLSDLDDKNISVNTVLLQTSSTKLTMFLQDKIKRKFKCKAESLITVEGKSDLKKVKELIGVNPPFSDRWYVEINLDKFYEKDLITLIKASTTCVFFCTCSKYGIFKKFKEDLKDYKGLCDFYINYLRKPDLIYLYDAFTLSNNKLTKQLFDYVAQSYSGDIEALFKLLLSLNEGKKFESRKDIADVCGIGGLSVESFIFSMIKPLSGSDKGLKTVLKNRITVGVDLGNTLGFSSMYNFMARSLMLFCEIKMLCMSGVVYKSIRKLPNTFDEKALSRYQKYVWKLKTIPMSQLLRLRKCMGEKVWNSELDFLNFIYAYYNIEARNCVEMMHSMSVDNS